MFRLIQYNLLHFLGVYQRAAVMGIVCFKASYRKVANQTEKDWTSSPLIRGKFSKLQIDQWIFCPHLANCILEGFRRNPAVRCVIPSTHMSG